MERAVVLALHVPRVQGLRVGARGVGAAAVHLVRGMAVVGAPGIEGRVRRLGLDIRARAYSPAAETRGESPW